MKKIEKTGSFKPGAFVSQENGMIINMSVLSSVFAEQIVEFITYKRALGMKYIIEAKYMKQFDRWCIEQRITNPILTQQIVEKWVCKRPTEKSKTHSNRISIIREFAKFLN